MPAAKPLLAAVLLALVSAGAASADEPTVRISRADQAKAESALLKLTDFGAGWAGGARKPSKLTGPNCPGFNPKESDLVVTGHAEAQFSYRRGGVTLAQDTQVLESDRAVRTDFSRSVKPGLPACLAYQLKASAKGRVTAVTMATLSVPRIGDVSAAYRATVSIRVNGKTAKLIRDFIFFGQGRYEYSIVVDAPPFQVGQLVPFETTIAQLLVKRSQQTGVA